ncbi:MAG TPA: nuclear transport factor 2 family protein [Acidimicrobiales bacterium]
MAEHPNVARIVAGYERFAARDLEGVIGLLADDVVWHVPGFEHKGRDEVAAYLVRLYEHTGGTLELDVLEVFADEHHAVAHVRETASRAADGARLDMREAHVFHLNPEGQAVAFWDVPADPDVHAAFFE